MESTSSTYQLTSVDYAHLIQFVAQKYFRVLLNKTQINKILFYVYGVYYAEKREKLFSDDTPKAWPYGPVFPIPNKKVNPQQVITSFPEKQLSAFKENEFALKLVVKSVEEMYNKSAVWLTKWSHQEGSPWYQTIYPDTESDTPIQKPWNTEIDSECIYKYFSNQENRLFPL